MALPITGPINVLDNVYSSSSLRGAYFLSKSRYKQKRPYDRPLAYSFVRMENLHRTEGNPANLANRTYAKPGWVYNPYTIYAWSFLQGSESQNLNRAIDIARNKARSKLTDKMREGANLAVALAERQQTLTMIASRAAQLRGFCRSLRRGQFGDAFEQLGTGFATPIKGPSSSGGDRRYRWVPRDPKSGKPTEVTMRGTTKGFANNFLEGHFGWVPLVKDIYAGVELLSEPIDRVRIKGKAGTSDVILFKSSNGSSEHTVEVRVSCGMEYAVTNPNLYLAQKLGLINPAVVVWEAIPFSFVLDWFVAVGDYLEQFSEFVGLTIVNPWTTVFAHDVCQTKVSDGTLDSTWSCLSQAITVQRTLALPSVKLVRKPVKISPTRAAVAISLLIQKGLKS